MQEHFIKKKGKTEEADIQEKINKVIMESELVFETANLRSGKTDQVTKQDVLDLKDKIIGILLNVPSRALSQMLRSWHCFRLEKSTNWTSINDKFVVDSSIMTDTHHPQANVSNGRITKNLEKLEIYISNVQLKLDGECLDNDLHSIEIALNYEMQLTVRLGKALLIDQKTEPKKLIRNL